jgi:small subunit ribosomal protein S24e
MKLEIVNQRENKTIGRKEIEFRIREQKSTPSRSEVKKRIAAMVNANENLVVVRKIFSRFGVSESIGIAHVYNSLDDLKVIENAFLLERDKRKGEKEKTEASEEKGEKEKTVSEEKKESSATSESKAGAS